MSARSCARPFRTLGDTYQGDPRWAAVRQLSSNVRAIRPALARSVQTSQPLSGRLTMPGNCTACPPTAFERQNHAHSAPTIRHPHDRIGPDPRPPGRVPRSRPGNCGDASLGLSVQRRCLGMPVFERMPSGRWHDRRSEGRGTLTTNKHASVSTGSERGKRSSLVMSRRLCLPPPAGSTLSLGLAIAVRDGDSFSLRR